MPGPRILQAALKEEVHLNTLRLLHTRSVMRPRAELKEVRGLPRLSTLHRLHIWSVMPRHSGRSHSISR